MESNQILVFRKEEVNLLTRIRDFLDDHLQETITINKLAQDFGINEDKLKSGFKKQFEVTLHQYIIRARMKKAGELVLQTNNPLKEIAASVGYKPRNFYDVFKKNFGVTPNSLRKQVKY